MTEGTLGMRIGRPVNSEAMWNQANDFLWNRGTPSDAIELLRMYQDVAGSLMFEFETSEFGMYNALHMAKMTFGKVSSAIRNQRLVHGVGFDVAWQQISFVQVILERYEAGMPLAEES